MSEDFVSAVTGVGALAEPARRSLYLYAARAAAPVSREQAAHACGVALHSAKFHLDRLVDEGLLEVEFRRLTGRTGPGAGRTAKLYRRADREVSVSLPERHYDLAGDVLAAAIDTSLRSGVPVADAVDEVARDRGRRLATDGAAPVGTDLERTADVLGRAGYEPSVHDGELCLRNCPFDRLAREHTDLVCGMNLSLVGGVLEALDCRTLTAELAPDPELCCVRARPR